MKKSNLKKACAREISKENSRLRPWSDLPREILELFLNRLSFADHARFGAVCSSWKSVVVESHHHKALQFPWLMGNMDPTTHTWIFISPMETKAYRLELPIASGSRCLDASHGWLLMTDPIRGYHLLNPFSEKRIQLPHESTIPFSKFPKIAIRRKYFLTKAILSSAPTTDKLGIGGCIVVAVHHPIHLFFCRPLDKAWSVIPYVQNQGKILDVIFHEELLYVLTITQAVMVFRFDPNPKIQGIYRPQRVVDVHHRFLSIEQFYLVASTRGEVLMALRLRDFPDHFLRNGDDDDDDDGYGLITKDCSFVVFKLDTSACKWVPMKSLGNQMLFFGDRGSKSLTGGADNSGYRGNCIYFMDMNDYALKPNIPCRVFCLEDGSNEPWCPNYSHSSMHSLTWFTPKA